MSIDNQHTYIVATIKDWNIDQYRKYSQEFDGIWHLISDKNSLNIENIKKINPKYIFFPHWSWIVPQEITSNYHCVCFHMTDLPYGRGGSPLQNLIIRGHTNTKITALRMIQKLDAGDIYLKSMLDLSGSAQDIFIRASKVIADMIATIIIQNPTPVKQVGKVSTFDRRLQKQSKLPNNFNLNQLYNHIRMLDAPSYPKAYIDYGNIRIKFNNANLTKNDKLTANITMEIIDNE